MYTKILNREKKSAVTLDQAKHQLNIIDDEGEDNSHIQLLVDASTNLAEKYTKRLFSKSEVLLSVTGKSFFFLPYGEVEGVSSVTVNGEEFTQYSFNTISQIFQFDEGVDIHQDFVITYEAGYIKLPEEGVMGILMLVNSLWENREDTVTGLTVSDIPLNSTAILDSIKLEWF